MTEVAGPDTYRTFRENNWERILRKMQKAKGRMGWGCQEPRKDEESTMGTTILSNA